MAQIIRHRRGSLESLSAATSSFQKGELIIVSGSSNITTTNGSGMVFAAVESASIQAVNRFLVGTNAPNVFSSSVYNGLVKGVPYYASGSSTLYLLGSGGNDVINLEGNIQPFSASVATSFSASNASITALSSSVSSVTGEFSSSVATSFSASNASLTSLSASVASVTGDFSSSVATSFSASNASLTSLSASVASVTGDFSSSVAQTFTTQSARISSLESFTGSYATTGSNVFVGKQSISSSLEIGDSAAVLQIIGNGFGQASIISPNGALVLTPGLYGVQINGANPDLTVDGGLTVKGNISGSTITGIGNVTAFSSSVDSRLSASVADITSLSASVASVTGDFSSSVATSFSASAASVAAGQSAQDTRIDSLSNLTGSYATTGSNIFYGTQVFTGSLYVAYDLIVQGSSSLQFITASQVELGTNRIILNNDSPAVRFGGISVQDSGSAQGASGSLLWDSLNNNWIYQHPNVGDEASMTAVLISGPRNSGSIGNETHITTGKIMVAHGDDHIGDSIATQTSDNSKITISGSLGVSGSIVVNSGITGTGSIFLQPDITDNRKLEIYNTAATDVHIKSTGGLTFLGDDTNYVKIDDSAQTITVRGVNGVSIETGLDVTGSISSSAGFSGSIAGIGNVSEYSASVSASIAALSSSVGSGAGVSITNLNAFTESFSSSYITASSSFDTRISNVSSSLYDLSGSTYTLSSSLDTRVINVSSSVYDLSGSTYNLSSSFDTRITNNSSSIFDLSGSAYSLSSSFDTRITNNSSSIFDLSGSTYNLSSSLDTRISNVSSSVYDLSGSSYSVSSSFDTRISNVSSSVYDLSGSTYSISSSFDTRITNNSSSLYDLSGSTYSVSSSFDTRISNVSSSVYDLSGSTYNLSSSLDIRISNVSSSVYDLSGSTYTLSSSFDTRITNNSSSIYDLSGSTYNLSSSFDTRISNVSSSVYDLSGSTYTLSSSLDTRITNTSSSLDLLSGSTYNLSSSFDTRITNNSSSIAALSASVASTTGDFSSSVSGRLTSLESTSASLNTSVSNLNSTTESLNISVAALNSYSSSLKTAFELTGSNVVVLGDLTVKGTTTSVESTTIQLGDNIIELNGTGVANGGLLVKDPTSPNTASGSLLWDSTNDYWKAGAAGAESKVALMDGDNLVTSSQQILFDQINGYSTFSGSVATSFSASNASITTLSASVASVTGDFSSSVATSFSASAASQLSLSSSFASSQATQNDRLGLLEISTGSLNSFTSSIDTTIKTKLDAETVVSGSSQVDITATTGFSTFSSSIETRISLIDGGTY
jgi:hypothetical protein